MQNMNLDELASVERTLTVKGVTYNVLEMTVGNFIDTNEAAKRMQEETDSAKALNESMALVKRSVPDLPDDVMRELGLPKLRRIVLYIQGALDEQVPVSAAEAPAAGEGEGDEAKK